MKYISRRNGDGPFDLGRYAEYLDHVRPRIAALIDGDDLLGEDRFFSLSSPRSFHDARLATLSIAVGEMGGGPQAKLRLEGAYWDRFFDLVYVGVVRSKVDVRGEHDDLLVHEIRLEEGHIVHEMLFASGATIEIVCDRIRFTETEEPREEA